MGGIISWPFSSLQAFSLSFRAWAYSKHRSNGIFRNADFLRFKQIQTQTPAWWPATLSVCAHSLVGFFGESGSVCRNHTILPHCDSHPLMDLRFLVRDLESKDIAEKYVITHYFYRTDAKQWPLIRSQEHSVQVNRFVRVPNSLLCLITTVA